VKPLIKLKEAVIVEGKYDKITLENIIDALIIPTNGFGIFKDAEKRKLIQTLAETTGIIIMTDSDSAGRMIRSHLKQICPKGKITNVYIPQLKGKEKRKDKPSKELLLGVEGMTAEIILKALQNSGVTSENGEKKELLTKTDLFLYGLSGGENSGEKRESLSKFLNIPTGFTPNAFLDIVNTLYGKREFLRMVELWQEDRDKN